MNSNLKSMINSEHTTLGIELGSTRIKAVLIGEDHTPIAAAGTMGKQTGKQYMDI